MENKQVVDGAATIKVIGVEEQKRIALDSNKERFVQKKGFGFAEKANFFNSCKAY